MNTSRYFRHFKGNYYKLLHYANDCETDDRLVVYRAMYGEGKAASKRGQISLLNLPSGSRLGEAKVLTRFRKEQKDLYELPEACTSCMSNAIDVIDVMSVQVHKGMTWGNMHKDLEKIWDTYIIDRYNEIDERSRLLLKYRYVGESNLKEEVKERIAARLQSHYATQRMEYMLERYPDLNDV